MIIFSRPPITPYNLFIHEISGAVKQEFPDATFSELPKIYSKKWSSLTLEEKQVNVLPYMYCDVQVIKSVI